MSEKAIKIVPLTPDGLTEEEAKPKVRGAEVSRYPEWIASVRLTI